MSSTTTTTTEQEQQQRNKHESSSSAAASDPMFDSGFCGSLRLSLQGSMTASSGSAASGAAPTGAEAAEDEQERCRQMLRRMNIAASSDEQQQSQGSSDVAAAAATVSPPVLREDAWREFFDPDEDGDVQLHLAIASGFADVAFALIRMAPHPDLLGVRNHAGYAPLHIAVLQNQPAVVRRLVVAGAALDVRDAEGNTPLHLAARRGNLECAEALLRPVQVQEMRDAQLSSPALLTSLPVDVIDLRNHLGEHCVHLATMGGHAHFLRFLCWNNADMNAADGRAGRSALHLAVGAGDVAIAQVLVEPRPRGCGVDLAQPDWYGRTPCQLALLNGNLALADVLARAMTGDASASAAALFPVEAAAMLSGAASGSDSDTEKVASLLVNSSA